MIFSRLSPNREVTIRFDRFKQKIVVGENILSNFVSEVKLKKYSKIILFVDKFVLNNHKEKIDNIVKGLDVECIISFIPSEIVKSVERLGYFIEKCHAFGLDRKGCILGIGGGITGDVGGFISSVYMRGIDFVYLL